MSNSMLCNANFGPSRINVTGSHGVGYAILDQDGSIVVSNTTAGVYQLAPDSGLYAAFVSFPDSFNGQIVWTCPSFTGPDGTIYPQAYATEGFNLRASDSTLATVVEVVDTKVTAIENDMSILTKGLQSVTDGNQQLTTMVQSITGSIQAIYDMSYGRWKIDHTTSQMYFYDASGVNLIATFNLYDGTFAPSTDAVFQRQNAAFPSSGP